ncbi:sigma 54 type regulator [Streptomyces olivaceoviridis]|uniref:sigma-54-dependent Fis family transcriptional regulator n=1 Tax=Streptomyces olivaceoviridis TaxID=1921 RepID=UPI0016753E47|nr:helix-turn-helix domain-containing protein [Streptomyces olivaceoviridis]GGZ15362.1 sigma 54 type regulator [Streptomyces olivaceoviridis]
MSTAPVHAFKDEWLTGSTDGTGVAPELLRSWERSREALGAPSNVREVPYVPEDDLDQHLLDLFQAPMSRFSADLSGTGVGLLLADARGRILGRWAADRDASRHFETVGTDRGAVLDESLVGTNGVGTVLATGQSVQITGAEHYADIYSDALCTGTPIRHPLSQKIVAVVTLSSGLIEGRSLLRPMVKTVADQLQQHLLDAASPKARAVFQAFLDASKAKDGAMVGFGPQGLIMQNQGAARLSSADVTALGELAQRRSGGRFVIELSGGLTEVRVAPVEAGAGAIVSLHGGRTPATTASGPVRTQLVGRSPDWMAARHAVARRREAARPVVIAGEAGVGKTSLALGLPFRPGEPGPGAHIVIDTVERSLIGGKRWLRGIAERLQGGAPVIVKGIDALDPAARLALAGLLERSVPKGPVLLTATLRSAAEAEETAVGLGATHVWVPPLRERTADLLALWRHFTDRAMPGVGLEPRSETLDLLTGYAWPRNLKELRNVVEGLALAGKRGYVLPGDLPERIQGARTLTMIERAELDAISRALREAEGNRSRAAQMLGLSRATIYRKMKAYKLTDS